MILINIFANVCENFKEAKDEITWRNNGKLLKYLDLIRLRPV